MRGDKLPTLGPGELIVILVIIFLLFGARKLPELSKGIGDSMKELRKGFNDDTKDDKKTVAKDDEKKS